MIAEILMPAKVVPGLSGDFNEAVELLCRRSPVPELAGRIRQQVLSSQEDRYSYIGHGIAVPHVRIENLTGPEIILGLAPEGLSFNGEKVSVILLLATPADQPAQHLQLLQRIGSLFPAISHELARLRDPGRVLQTIARAEQQSVQPSYINLTQDQIAFELQTDLEKGLTYVEAGRRLSQYGPNVLHRVASTPWYVKLLRNLFSFFAVLLWMAALLCFLPAVNLPQLGLAILVVIFVNGLFAFFQEYRSDRALEMLQELIALKCRVVRDGFVTEIDAINAVPGDVVIVEEGDIAPADARLVDAFEVEVDNSSLTGESTPARRYKSDQPVLIPGRFLWIELPNIIFAGSSLLHGRGRAVVFGTGMNSEIGKIAGLTQGIQIEASPLQKQLRGTVFSIAGLAGGLGIIFLLLGWLVAGLSFLEAFVFFIGLFVANVPEGLLPTVTLALAMGVKRMGRRHALVKNLPSVETLGCTTVICCDKTGTLTQNLMMATELAVDEKIITVSGSGYRPEGEFTCDGALISPQKLARWIVLRRLLECAFICNNARLEKSGADFRVVGDPTEGALVCLAQKAGVHGTYLRLHLNPFESIRKRMSVVVKIGSEYRSTAYVKGAPIEILENCDRMLRDGEERPLTDADRKRFVEQNDHMAGRGLRVLAFAYREDEELDSGSYAADRIERRLVSRDTI